MSELRDKILGKMDVLAEFLALGVRIPPGARPDRNGWLSCHSFYREDKDPSAGINLGPDLRWKGIYIDFGEAGYGGKPWLVKGIFQMAVEFGPYGSPGHAFYSMARKYGVITGEPPSGGRGDQPPTLDDVERFKKNLVPEVLQFLRDKRGLADASIARFDLGWDPKRERNAIPVWEPAPAGKRLVNIRFHNSKKTPKTLNWPGFGEARLFGRERLAMAPPGATVIITEGEFDAMLADQETGSVGVSSTNGVKAFKPEWAKDFHGRHVVLLYDSDKEGREGVQHLVLPAFKEMVQSGQVPSLKVIWLYDKPDKDHKDLTDWIVKDGGSGEALKKLVQEAPPYTYPTATSHLPDPLELKSFTEIDKSEHAGQRVTVNLQVFGENTVAYYAAKKIQVTHCPRLQEGKCTGPKGKDGACMEDIHVPLGDRVLIAGVRATEGQFKNLLRDYVCDQDKRPTLRVEDADKVVVRELWAHQIFEPMQFDQKHQIEKPVYVLGGDLIELGKYRATGRIVGSYRDQQPTLLVDTFVPQEEDYQCFNLDTARPYLQKLQEMTPDEIAEDLSLHVTRIYKRPLIHLGVLLVLASPLWVNFPGEGRIRGWLSTILVGDTGTGKTSISQGLFEFARVGERVSGLTASRTGITYGMDHDERKGWRVKAGALLKMSRQALIVDEAQDLPEHELKTMAEGLDTGIVKIDRIQHRVFEAATRTIFSCNPRPHKNSPQQRKMEDFRHGAQSIEGLFPDMMIRRVDFCMFATSGDIENKEEIFNPSEDPGPPQVLAEDLRALIFWAWNLKENQIIIPPEVAREIRREALEISNEFGCDSPPIVYPEDFRKTMARLCVAFAVLDLSANEDFTQVIVTQNHVREVADFLAALYWAENCRLHKQAQAYRESYGLDDLNGLKGQIDNILASTPDRRDRFVGIVAQLLRCVKGERLRRADLVEEFDVDKRTIQRDMRWFVKNRLVKSNIQSGYAPEPRLFKLMGRLEKMNPEKYKFEDIDRDE